jgi:hypothetical protein
MSGGTVRNGLFVIGAALLLVSLFARYVVINGFVTHPTNAVSSSGETIPYEVKGKTVFITPAEEKETTAILSGEIVGLAILLIYGMIFVSRRQ